MSELPCSLEETGVAIEALAKVIAALETLKAEWKHDSSDEFEASCSLYDKTAQVVESELTDECRAHLVGWCELATKHGNLTSDFSFLKNKIVLPSRTKLVETYCQSMWCARTPPQLVNLLAFFCPSSSVVVCPDDPLLSLLPLQMPYSRDANDVKTIMIGFGDKLEIIPRSELKNRKYHGFWEPWPQRDPAGGVFAYDPLPNWYYRRTGNQTVPLGFERGDIVGITDKGAEQARAWVGVVESVNDDTVTINVMSYSLQLPLSFLFHVAVTNYVHRGDFMYVESLVCGKTYTNTWFYAVDATHVRGNGKNLEVPTTFTVGGALKVGDKVKRCDGTEFTVTREPWLDECGYTVQIDGNDDDGWCTLFLKHI